MVLPALSRHIDPRLVDFRKDVPAQDPSEETLVEFVILHGHNSSLESGIEQFSRQAFPFSLPKRHYGLNARVSADPLLSLIHISEPTRLGMISYAVFCLKKKKKIN